MPVSHLILYVFCPGLVLVVLFSLVIGVFASMRSSQISRMEEEARNANNK